ncbi:hypothetical protein NDA11_005072 [Ustilago hordei]|uniref:pectinesterase n=1 Tax=Ustilago hordei TaxID=120017 RepID=I2FWZ8_USTHO|nr:uncharacterized protein UHO2_04263 [Ustilago hordei]KAJ1037092.1 hypothetical protein NDA10_004049 [Ustilago hordei]KAJ1573725.1 hypothetical protein NDA15_002478 [Ustilago hordei]KAJ1579373.1 hypothetical protein NDA11_005072 [Ustilago hordei]KAJ1579721.1 hypothetical protein NDA12_005525 [Ustilago hordei]CCF51441.1 uncharacterized protein UHOR_14934 [Ustilago hordei]
MLSHSYFLACFITLNFLSNWGRAAPVYEEDLHVSNSFTSFLDGKCQAPKLPGIDPLSGCPKDTIFVSQKHPSARYRTINSVLNALPDDGTLKNILIDEGIYHEKVIVRRISPTIFAGVTPNNRDPSANRVQVWQSSYVNQSDPISTMHNCDAVVLGIGTGAAASSSDFKAYNINFVQRQFFKGQEVTQYQLGPAAALCVHNSNASFYGCGFSSFQDTIYVGLRSQAFFFKSTVKGMTDQLYGQGKAWLEQVSLLSRGCGGGITAWRGDPVDPLVGVYISNSNINRSPDASTLKPMEKACYLGRPWNVYSHSTYLNTYMSNIIADAGFKVWSKRQSNFDPRLTRFAEYRSSGPGGYMGNRDYPLKRALTDKEAKGITYKKVFGGSTPWIDSKTMKNW